MDIALKLHLPEMAKIETKKTVLEQMTDALIRDASLRIRREPEVLLHGLAERPRTTPLPPLNTINDQEDEKYERLSLFEEQEQKTNTRLRVKAAAMANNLTSTQIPNTESTQKRYHHSFSSSHSHPHRSSLPHSKQINNKPSTENWIPEPIRFRSLHRELMDMQENLRSTISFERDNNREIRRFQTTDLQKDLMKEELKLTKKKKCVCCLQIYSLSNLPMKVPIKAILDIRKKWTSDKTHSNPNGEWWKKDDERLSAIPRCYEGVLICTFCSQFFDVQEEYRPSFDKIQKEIKRKQYAEAKRLEKQYWDPLKTGELEMERLYQAELLSKTTGGTMTIGEGSEGRVGDLLVEGLPESTTNGLVTIQYE
jgi:hypothetical protein